MPYGQPGDRLYVKEAWRTAKSLDAKSPTVIAEICINAGYRQPWAPLAYEADGYRNAIWRGFEIDGDAELGKTRASIHMPRWASRITLEVTGVRVERVQDISEADARAEGITDGGCTNCGNPEPSCGCLNPSPNARDAFCNLWGQINGEKSWHENPWVWAVEFKRVEGGAP